ncbi:MULTISPECIES: head-tail adaptor protein [Rhodopseudomonas]|uniref:Head-tail adaptor protein n=1 Tax=Rhodopseudomonas palustris TaxID=1076 RepID=A0A0D7EI82_RHOPL|nr:MULTISPECIES: head-tail adaptor protein [Rhodopseudomonas]KIZ40215.1 head-tail adaptor protein [Rhodopseudomonas palustris]WOK19968.1 head-tail adaptor protein [Rhodopseudomonas sp. BAL398]
MIDPGRLKSRLAIEAPVEADDGQGGVTRSYATQAVVWAAVTPLAARDSVEADAAGAALRVRIVIRRGVALTLRHRLVDGTAVYRIVAFREIDDRRFIAIEAELRLE